MSKSKSDSNSRLHNRLCARIVVPNPLEMSFISLVADEDECPTTNDITNDINSLGRKGSLRGGRAREDTSIYTRTKWRFNLTRTSNDYISTIIMLIFFIHFN